MGSMLAILRRGIGISILPALTARYVASRELRFVSLTRPTLERKLSLVRRAGRSLTPAAQLLWDRVQTVAAALPRQPDKLAGSTAKKISGR